MTGNITFRFADLAPGNDVPAPIEILDVGVQVDGHNNPFGCVKSGFITMKASVTRAKWNTTEKAWALPGNFDFHGIAHSRDLKIIGTNKEAENPLIGIWWYDDRVNGILPGPMLTAEEISEETASSRCIPIYSY